MPRGENDEFITATQILPVTIQEGDIIVIFMTLPCRSDGFAAYVKHIRSRLIGFFTQNLSALYMITLTLV